MNTFVVIPTYNERDNIIRLAGEVLSQHASIRILFVDDNSPDGTGVIADELAEGEPFAWVQARLLQEGHAVTFVADVDNAKVYKVSHNTASKR